MLRWAVGGEGLNDRRSAQTSNHASNCRIYLRLNGEKFERRRALWHIHRYVNLRVQFMMWPYSLFFLIIFETLRQHAVWKRQFLGSFDKGKKVYSTQFTNSVNALDSFINIPNNDVKNRHLYIYKNINVKYKSEKIYILCLRLVKYVPSQRNKWQILTYFV